MLQRSWLCLSWGAPALQRQRSSALVSEALATVRPSGTTGRAHSQPPVPRRLRRHAAARRAAAAPRAEASSDGYVESQPFRIEQVRCADDASAEVSRPDSLLHRFFRRAGTGVPLARPPSSRTPPPPPAQHPSPDGFVSKRAQVSFGSILSPVGVGLMVYGFGAFFQLLPGGDLSSLMLIYGGWVLHGAGGPDGVLVLARH